jgi:xanthine dehydrogenase accessory factor
MEDIYAILEAIDSPGEKVLATVIRVEGSAYKKEGSSMLLLEDGSQVGMVSPGCLEADLKCHMKNVLENGEAITICYDMSQETDLEWGQGGGCNGIIEILLEPVTKQLVEDLLEMKKALGSNKPVLCLKKIKSKIEYLFIPKNGEPFGNWKGDQTVHFHHAKSGMQMEKLIFQHIYHPKPRLIVFGAGADAKPLVRLAKIVGFSVLVCDWREEYCNSKNFPSADHLFLGFPKELNHKINYSPDDYLVIMSHQFQRDQEILLSLLHKKVKYLGVLGPVERTKRLLNGHSIPAWIHSPVGMAINAKGPDEIAVSIVAEMIQVFRNPIIKKVRNL